MNIRLTINTIFKLATLATSITLCELTFAATPIKIGAIFPLSGGAGQQGQQMVKALNAMADIINKQGGVMGRPIEIEARDDESTPAVGVSKATELISDHVAAFIGGFNSPVTLAMQPVIARANILNITVTPKADDILSGKVDPYAVRLNSSNGQDGQITAEYIKHSNLGNRIAFLTENDAYGKDAEAAIRKSLDKANYSYQVVSDEKFPFAQTDFRIPLTTIAASKPNLTVIINANQGVGLPALLRQFRQQHVSGQIWSAVGTLIPDTVALAGDAANGVVSADYYMPNIEPFSSNPVHKVFLQKMEQEYKLTPDKYMAIAAVGLQTWAMAANELKTLDRAKIGAKFHGGEFKNTIMGNIKYEANGQLIPHYFFQTVKKGKIVILKSE